MNWAKVINILSLIVILLVIGVVIFGVIYGIYMESYTNITSNADGTSKVRVGDLVQFRFKACPTALTVAAFGADGSANNIINDPNGLASQSCLYCDLPGAIGTNSIWIGNGGNGYQSNPDFQCTSVTKVLGLDSFNKCSKDSDCNSITMMCNPSISSATCLINVGDPTAPPGSGASNVVSVSCVRSTLSAMGGFCDLSSIISTLESQIDLGFQCGTDGLCHMYEKCPPPPVCYVGMDGPKEIPNANTNQVTGFCSSWATVSTTSLLPQCRTIDPTTGFMDPTCPCTGCYPGQTCAHDSTGWGTCSGQASGSYIVTRVDFIAEGQLVSISALGDYYFRWDQVQCVYPFVNNLPDRGPRYYLGCIVARSNSNAQMVSDIFGEEDPSNPGLYLDAYGPSNLTVGSVILNSMTSPDSSPQFLGSLPWYLPSKVSNISQSYRRVSSYSAKMGEYKFPPRKTLVTNFFASITDGVPPPDSI
jgi:hypothetical protein